MRRQGLTWTGTARQSESIPEERHWGQFRRPGKGGSEGTRKQHVSCVLMNYGGRTKKKKNEGSIVQQLGGAHKGETKHVVGKQGGKNKAMASGGAVSEEASGGRARGGPWTLMGCQNEGNVVGHGEPRTLAPDCAKKKKSWSPWGGGKKVPGGRDGNLPWDGGKTPVRLIKGLSLWGRRNSHTGKAVDGAVYEHLVYREYLCGKSRGRGEKGIACRSLGQAFVC